MLATVLRGESLVRILLAVYMARGDRVRGRYVARLDQQRDESGDLRLLEQRLSKVSAVSWNFIVFRFGERRIANSTESTNGARKRVRRRNNDEINEELMELHERIRWRIGKGGCSTRALRVVNRMLGFDTVRETEFLRGYGKTFTSESLHLSYSNSDG